MPKEVKPQSLKVGGPRPGRVKGSPNKFSQDIAREAKEQGILPHEFLLKIVRGEPIEQKRYRDMIDKQGNIVGREVVSEEIYATLDMRQDAAKAAAPYYAPRLATQIITLRGREDLLNSMTDEQVEQAIKDLSSEVKSKRIKAD